MTKAAILRQLARYVISLQDQRDYIRDIWEITGWPPDPGTGVHITQKRFIILAQRYMDSGDLTLAEFYHVLRSPDEYLL